MSDRQPNPTGDLPAAVEEVDLLRQMLDSGDPKTARAVAATIVEIVEKSRLSPDDFPQPWLQESGDGGVTPRWALSKEELVELQKREAKDREASSGRERK